jgi:hypothetical protein
MNPHSLLHRQVHPTFFKNAVVSSQVFKPTPKDNGLLSTYDGDLIGAADLWTHYTSKVGLLSVGVLSVTGIECGSQTLAYRLETEGFYPEHAVIDFTGCTRGEIERKSKALRDFAVSRGWQFGPV